ncbi:hypothetical protein [Methylobacterium sp. JK268]
MAVNPFTASIVIRCRPDFDLRTACAQLGLQVAEECTPPVARQDGGAALLAKLFADVLARSLGLEPVASVLVASVLEAVVLPQVRRAIGPGPAAV